MWKAITMAAALGALILTSAPAGAQQVLSPYRDQQFTMISRLFDAELGELKNGTGMGLARAAGLDGCIRDRGTCSTPSPAAISR
jgi:hypothetical protein